MAAGKARRGGHDGRHVALVLGGGGGEWSRHSGVACASSVHVAGTIERRRAGRARPGGDYIVAAASCERRRMALRPSYRHPQKSEPRALSAGRARSVIGCSSSPVTDPAHVDGPWPYCRLPAASFVLSMSQNPLSIYKVPSATSLLCRRRTPWFPHAPPLSSSSPS